MSVAVVGVERRVGVEVDHRRRAAVGGREHQRVDRDLALLEIPVRPHRLVAGDVARGSVDVDRHREAEHPPELLRPRARARRRPARRPRWSPLLVSTAVTLPSSARPEAGDLGVRQDLDALGEALVAKPEHRLHVEREPALVLVQADRHALRAPVREEPLHVGVDLGLAGDQLGAVADPLVALEDGRQVGLLRLRRRARCSRRRCSGTPPGRTPRPRRRPASARSSPAGSSCCARRRTRSRSRPRRASPCRRRRCRCPSRARARGARPRGGRRSRGRGCRRRRRRSGQL